MLIATNTKLHPYNITSTYTKQGTKSMSLINFTRNQNDIYRCHNPF